MYLPVFIARREYQGVHSKKNSKLNTDFYRCIWELQSVFPLQVLSAMHHAPLQLRFFLRSLYSAATFALCLGFSTAHATPIVDQQTR